MATQQIAWGDGSGDKIYVTYPSASGDQTLSVSSDANTGITPRSKIITIATLAGSPSKSVQLNVSQLGQSLPNYAYEGIYYKGFTGGYCVFGYGHATYMISPFFSLESTSSLTFSLGGTNVGHLLFFDKDTYLYNNYYTSNANPRTVSLSATLKGKLCALCFQKSNLASTYAYDNTNQRYLFNGADFDSSMIHTWKQFRGESQLADAIIWENARGDFENWNFAANANASTENARNVYEPTIYRVVRSASNTSAAYYSSVISKEILLPKDGSGGKSPVEFSLGKAYGANTSPCLLLYDDDGKSANYYQASPNPRSVNIDGVWDHIRFVIELSYYSTAYVTDTVTGTTLWQGPS